ncbi:TPA: VOC family protein [Klebsiella pneumoniae]
MEGKLRIVTANQLLSFNQRGDFFLVCRDFLDDVVVVVNHTPGDYPVGKQGDVFTAELRVTRMPCLGLNDGPVLQHKETCSFQVATDDQAETDHLWSAIIDNWGVGERVWLVQGRVGRFVVDHPAYPDGCHTQP